MITSLSDHLGRPKEFSAGCTVIAGADNIQKEQMKKSCPHMPRNHVARLIFGFEPGNLRKFILRSVSDGSCTKAMTILFIINTKRENVRQYILISSKYISEPLAVT